LCLLSTLCLVVGGWLTGMILSIRDYPDDLQRRIRRAAVNNDESMKAVIIRACERELERQADSR
jgi:hypothetical protein